MEHYLYSLSLSIALPLMLFFGFYFLFAKTPEKAIFDNYRRSRRIMGIALLLLAANYSVHLFLSIRFVNAKMAILMNLSTYFLCYWLFSSALTTLLDRFYITKPRMRFHIGMWVVFSAISATVLILLPGGAAQTAGLVAMAVWLVGYGLFLSHRLLSAYRRAVNFFNDTHSDDIGSYMQWMSTFTYWALTFGVGCGVFTFLPDKWVFVWILSSIPFYIYLFCCYLNYLLFYEQVESAMDDEAPAKEVPGDIMPYQAEMAEKILEWIDADGYIRPGLTIQGLSEQLHTNRTYLSKYINTTYGMSFRDWVTGMRIEYAKRLLVQNPKLTIADISARSGFQSPSHFIRLFRESTNCSPAKWRKSEIGRSDVSDI